MSADSTGRRVVVLGSINVDYVATLPRLPAAGETVGGGTLAIHQGGKGANQAVAAARCGATTWLIGAVGQDPAGQVATDCLRAEGIDVRQVRRVNEPTGTALIMVDAAGSNLIAVAPGANAHVQRRDLDAVLDSLPGVLVTGFEIPVDVAVDAVLAARSRNWTVVLNPAPAISLPPALHGSGVIVVPNEPELAVITGSDGLERGLLVLGGWTGGPAIVTRGSDGAAVNLAGLISHHAAVEVDPVDTTGAGDAFIGALAAALALGMDLESAVPYAMAVAGASVAVPGARAPVPEQLQLTH